VVVVGVVNAAAAAVVANEIASLSPLHRSAGTNAFAFLTFGFFYIIASYCL